ncbi:lyase family protein [Nonomuraea recticatena]|uniref:lyase family protein n=1 Tax=Nonomuraea recticatena TaxID=46178 RepID=UPI003619AECB
MHLGATSQDIMDTALMLVAHRALGAVLSDLARTAGALAVLAAEHRDTPMPGRTLTQHAVPTTFGLKAAGWRALALDAHDRLLAVRRSLPAQLGGAAGTMAAFSAISEGPATSAVPPGSPGPALVEVAESSKSSEGPGGSGSLEGSAGSGGGPAGVGPSLVAGFARETGLAEPVLPWHVLRTPVADLGGALAFTAGALGKMAADVLVLSRTEIGEVSEAAGAARRPCRTRATRCAPPGSPPPRAGPRAGRRPLRRAGRRGRASLGGLACRVADPARPAAPGRRRGEGRRRPGGGAAGRSGADAREPRPDGRPHRLRTSRRRADPCSRQGARQGPARRGLPGQGLREALEQAVGDRLALDDLLDPTHYLGSAPALVDRALRRTPGETP